MGGPRDTSTSGAKATSFSFQITVGQRFEHLAAKRGWHVFRNILETRAGARARTGRCAPQTICELRGGGFGFVGYFDAADQVFEFLGLEAEDVVADLGE